MWNAALPNTGNVSRRICEWVKLTPTGPARPGQWLPRRRQLADMVTRPRFLTLAAATLLASMAWAAPFADGVAEGRPSAWPEAGQDVLLPVDEALRVGPATWAQGRLSIDFEAAPGCYFYRDRLSVVPTEGSRSALPLDLTPEGEAYFDDHFGAVKVWRKRQSVSWALQSPPSHVEVRYQGCAEGKVCYTPQTRLLEVLSLD